MDLVVGFVAGLAVGGALAGFSVLEGFDGFGNALQVRVEGFDVSAARHVEYLEDTLHRALYDAVEVRRGDRDPLAQFAGVVLPVLDDSPEVALQPADSLAGVADAPAERAVERIATT